MKERQRWRPEEDAVLRAYVRQYGPREWQLVSQRMNIALDRDAKSCLERWKNYLRPGIKKGSLTDDEQRLVITLQAKHGNKWKKIAAEVPGRTAKRLGKWWEVFKEKQQRELRDSRRPAPEPSPDERGRYDWLLENFAEKLVGDRPAPPQPLIMAGAPVMPPWLSPSNTAVVTQPPPPPRPPSPSVTLSLASAAAVAPPPPGPAQWMPDRAAAEAAAAAYGFASPPQHAPPHAAAGTGMAVVEGQALAELAERLRELEEGQRAWAAHRREAAAAGGAAAGGGEGGAAAGGVGGVRGQDAGCAGGAGGGGGARREGAQGEGRRAPARRAAQGGEDGRAVGRQARPRRQVPRPGRVRHQAAMVSRRRCGHELLA
ncbi:unnamed protein product [Urochloa humidicola]